MKTTKTKRELAEKYVELKKEFDGKDFKPTIQMHNVEWLTKEFKKEDLEDKVNAVQSAIEMRNKRLSKEETTISRELAYKCGEALVYEYNSHYDTRVFSVRVMCFRGLYEQLKNLGCETLISSAKGDSKERHLGFK